MSTEEFLLSLHGSFGFVIMAVKILEVMLYVHGLLLLLKPPDDIDMSFCGSFAKPCSKNNFLGICPPFSLH